MSRLSTSHGERPSSSSSLPKHTLKIKASKVFNLSNGDETNYEILARSSPHKAALAPKDNLDSFLSDDEDLVPITKKVPIKAPAVKAPIAKRGPKPKPKPAPVEKKAAPAPKPTQLSPAAKAYAKKLAKKDVFSDDEDDEVIMNDSPPPKPAAKANAKKLTKKNVISDDEDEVSINDSPPPKLAARGRPARAAVVKAKQTKPVYIDSEDEDEMDVDEEDASALVDDESEDDFDESE
jgi:DNA topoisomerase-2